MKSEIIILSFLLAPAITLAQTTRPATQNALKSMPADQLMQQVLKPSDPGEKPLPPATEKQAIDKTSGKGAVKPTAPPVVLLREGTPVVDRVVRLAKDDKGQAEIMFESDGKALRDPPMLVLPNSKLAVMEDSVADRDRKFRVTGIVTEYRGRNYILLEKVLIVPDAIQQF